MDMVILKKFALSFFVVLVMPVTFFSVFFLSNFQKIYQEKIIEQTESTLKAVAMELDRNMETMEDIGIHNSRLSYIQKYAMLEDVRAKEIISILASELVTHPFMEEIEYYNRVNSNTIYSSQGTYSLQYYARLCAGVESGEELLEMLEKIDYSGCFLWNGNESICYCYRANNREWWIFTISKSKLKEIIFEENSATKITDQQGNLLYSTENTGITSEGDSLIEIHLQSDFFLLTRYYSKDFLFEEIVAWRNFFVLMVLLVLFLGGILVVLLTFYNGYPFVKLQRYCAEKLKGIPETVQGLDVLEYTLNSMEIKKNAVENRLLKNQLLTQMIYGRNCYTEEFAKCCEDAGLFLRAECYRVVMVRSKEGNLEEFEKLLQMTVNPEYEFHAVEMAGSEKIVLITGMLKKQENRLENELNRISILMKEKLGMNVSFYMGGKCSEIGKICYSYHQAVICSAKKETEKSVISYQPPKSKKFIYPKKEIELLSQTLRERKLDKADLQMDKLLKILSEQSENSMCYSSLGYDILNVYEEAFQEIGKSQSEIQFDIDILEIVDSHHLIQVIQQVRNQFRHYVEDISSGNDDLNEKEENIGKILNFIEENSQSCDLNVSMVADHFHMSISNLSHQFKGQMNCTISEYITIKKFEYAGKLLLETEETIQTIAQILGYAHTTSFIRKFKQYYGMTPLEYRNKCEMEPI